MLTIFSLRRRLQRNKVFFETLASITLTIMAVLVSWHATRIAALQTELTKLEKQPIFRFDVVLQFDPATQVYARDRLVVSNIGTPVREFDCRVYTFFKAEYGRRGQPLKTALIPLHGYYSASGVSKNLTGELQEFVAPDVPEGNNSRAANLIRGFGRRGDQHDAFAFLDVLRYVRVRYKDIWGEWHDDLYLVGSFTSSKLEDRDARLVIIEYETKWSSSLWVEFAKASPELLYEKWKAAVAAPSELPNVGATMGKPLGQNPR